MNPSIMGNPMMGMQPNMMDSIKNNMMTMFMMRSMNSDGKTDGKQDNNMFGMLYMFLVTQVIDFVMKNIPVAVDFVYKKYTEKVENITKEIMNVVVDTSDNKVKKKTASISITININDQENLIGQSLLDYITNCKNTTHVSFTNKHFILNQKDIICIDEDIYSSMTQSSSDSASTTSTSSSSAIVQIIEIYSFTKTIDELREFLDKIKMNYLITIKNKLGNHRYFFNLHPCSAPSTIDNGKDYSKMPNNFTFIMKKFQTNRKFHNLFGEGIDIIRNRVNFFIKNKKWYDEKGIPYTLGLLLSGNPGTGKTSTIKCLANETNRHIFNINLNNDITKLQLENLFFNDNVFVLNQSTGQQENYFIPLDQRIYVMEDIDCQSDIVMERSLKLQNKIDNTIDNTIVQDPTPKSKTEVEKKKEAESKYVSDMEKRKEADKKYVNDNNNKYKIDLSFLLNLLDGVLENPGRIIVMTSNFPDVLDSALVRPGRIDIIAKFRNCSNKTIIEMTEFFYDMKLTDNYKNIMLNLQPEIVTPAEMGKIMFENFSDYLNVINTLEDLSKTCIIKKEQERAYQENLEQLEKEQAREQLEKEQAREHLERELEREHNIVKLKNVEPLTQEQQEQVEDGDTTNFIPGLIDEKTTIEDENNSLTQDNTSDKNATLDKQGIKRTVKLNQYMKENEEDINKVLSIQTPDIEKFDKEQLPIIDKFDKENEEKTIDVILNQTSYNYNTSYTSPPSFDPLTVNKLKGNDNVVAFDPPQNMEFTSYS